MKKSILALILPVLLLTSCGGGITPLPDPDPEPEDTTYIDIVAINDLHGKMSVDTTDKDPGIAKISRYIDYRRARNPQGTVLLSVGDMWQGSSDSNSSKGGLMTTWMNDMKFDAMTLGNHEFDWGEEIIRSNLTKADFPFLGGNIFEYGASTPTLVDYVEPYTVITRKDINIGVIGMIGATQWTSIVSTVADNFEFKGPLTYVEAYSNKLRDELDCDLVLLLIHDGAKSGLDSMYGNYVDGVICGHSHKSYYEDGSIPVVEGNVDGHNMSILRYSIDNKSKEVTYVKDECYYTPDNVLYNYDASPEVTEFMNENTNQAANKEVIGTIVNNDLEINNRLSKMSAKSMFDYVKENYDYDIDYAVDSLDQRNTLYTGPVTYERLYKAMPFDNEIVILKITGTQLKKFISVNSFYREEIAKIVSDQEYLVAASDYIAYHKNSARSYDYIPSFDVVTNIEATLNGLYAREIVKETFIAARNAGKPIDGSIYTGDHYSTWND